MYSERYADWRVKAFRANYLKSLIRGEIADAQHHKKQHALKMQKTRKGNDRSGKAHNRGRTRPPSMRNLTMAERLDVKYALEAPKLHGTNQNKPTPSQKSRAEYEKIRNAKERTGESYPFEKHMELKARKEFHRGQYEAADSKSKPRPEIAKFNGKTYVKSLSKQAPDRSALRDAKSHKYQTSAATPPRSKEQHKAQVVRLNGRTFVKDIPSQKSNTPDRSAIKPASKQKDARSKKSRSPRSKDNARSR